MGSLTNALAKAFTATLALWPTWAHGAFAVTNTHPTSKGTPAQRGMLAVAVAYMLGNGATWYCGNTAQAVGTCCAYHVGMLAYGTATVAYAKAGGKLRQAKCYAGITGTSTPAQAAQALAKAGFAPTTAVLHGMLGTVANATAKGAAPLYATVTNGGTLATASTASPVPGAYNGVPAAQPPKGYTLPKVARMAVGNATAPTTARKPRKPAQATAQPAQPVAAPATPTTPQAAPQPA